MVGDVSTIPAALPQPTFPSFSAFPGLLIPVFLLAFVGLMQGTSISQSVPNPDGKFPDVSRDFFGQGMANLQSNKIIILRSKDELGSTLIEILNRSVQVLHAHESKLYLSEVNEFVRPQLRRTGLLRTIGPENVFMASEIVGEATLEAIFAGEAWIARVAGEES